MYLAHLIYLLGLNLALRSWLGAVIKTGAALWFAVESSAMIEPRNQARQVLPGVYEESARLDFKRTKLEIKTKAEKQDALTWSAPLNLINGVVRGVLIRLSPVNLWNIPN